MGFYDPSWSDLEPRIQYDIQLRLFIIILHNIMAVFICLKRYNHEVKDNMMRFTSGKKKFRQIRILREINFGEILGEEESIVVPKSLESFLSNCVIMGIMFVGIFTFGAYRR